MKNAIMIPIPPELVVKILNGEKTIEIQKTAPKCDLPIDVYIYCTKSGVVVEKDCGLGFPEPINGKVVAKFTLRKINEYRCSVYIPEKGIALQHKVGLQSESDYPSNVANRQNWGWEGPKLKEILDGSCLSEKELALYLTNESNIFNGFYAWHISDLQIFDEPKGLSEFYTLKCSQKKRPCNIKDVFDVEECHRICKLCKPLAKAPRSWQYVEKGE